MSFSTPEDKKCVDEALALTDTGTLAGRMMGALSGGELQAALIAGAVAQETPFLLLDEPTAHLDPYHQENVRLMIERVHTQRGTAVITVTHDVNLALSAHENIMALVDGRIFYYGGRGGFSADAVGNLAKVFSIEFCAAGHPNQKTFYFPKGGLE
jgi:iron complex transport system ATP-binding protein